MRLTSRTTLIQLFVDLMKGFWPHYLGATICLLINHLLMVRIPFLAKDLAENLQKVGIDRADIPYGEYVALAIGIVLFRTLSRYYFFYPARVHQRDCKLNLLEVLEKTNPKRYESYNSGQLFQVLQNDFDYLRVLMGFVFLQVVNIFLALAVMIPKLMHFDVAYLRALTPLFFTVMVFTYLMTKISPFQKEGMRLQGEVQQLLIECHQGKKTINNFQVEKSFLTLFEKRCTEELKTFFKAFASRALMGPLNKLGLGFTLLWGAWVTYEYSLGAGSFIMFSGMVYLIAEPLSFITWIGVVTQTALASWKRLIEFLSVVEKEELKNETKFPFTLKLTPGKVHLLVGETGVGKSTLLREISDSMKINSGKVDFVFQTPYLFSDTVENNIFLGLAKDERMAKKSLAIKLIHLLGLAELENSDESILNLEIGERGKRLSGGQAKRLALVRSLLSGADIFIWDDPFQAVDSLLEREIMQGIRSMQEFKDKTILLTSHRFTSLKYADEYFLMDRSEIKDSGKLQGQSGELKGPVYEFFKKQMV